ncbi:MAG: DUF6431 domain-containing protein [Lachnospiraceae bacterium]|jgi:hypothetical protein|nr:DUF6431 domain-containing protein [Lachnospiraceae bacterium]
MKAVRIVILGLLDIGCLEYKASEHDIYNSIREQANKGLIKCPNCHSGLGMHGTYKRKVITSDSSTECVNIIQVRCKQCRKVHAIIPRFIFPQKQYDAAVIENALGDKGLQTCAADDSTIRRWRRKKEDNVWLNQTISRKQRKAT